eukprot:14661121-Alexandrium_andersonii.AAC.1
MHQCALDWKLARQNTRGLRAADEQEDAPEGNGPGVAMSAPLVAPTGLSSPQPACQGQGIGQPTGSG